MYLLHDVLERVGAVDGEADEEQVGLGVGERPQPVILFLPGGVPQCELDGLATGLMRLGSNVVLENCGHIFLQQCEWMTA